MPITRRHLGLLFSATAAGGLIGPVSAVAADDDNALPNVFISPHGQPFRAVTGAAYPIAGWFAQADANGDGKLSKDEFLADAGAFFNALDLRGDGVLDDRAIQVYENRIAPEVLGHQVSVYAAARPSGQRLLWLAQYGGPQQMQAPSPQGLQGPAGSGQSQESQSDRDADAMGTGAEPFSLMRQPEPVTAADDNYVFSGVVKKGAFLDHAAANFAALDGDAKGYLTLAALPPTPVQHLLARTHRRHG